MLSTDKWMHCRMDPFTSAGGVRKPDGRGAPRTIVVDHLVADNITCNTASGFTIQTLPGMLPYSAMITGNGAALANDINVNGLAFNNPAVGGGFDGNWYPVGVATEWAATPTLLEDWAIEPTPRNDPYTSSRARIISVARRLIFTGNITQCSGFINVVPSPYSVNPDKCYVTNATPVAVANTIAMIRTDRLQAVASNTALQVPLGMLDIELTTVPPYNRETVTNRVELGARIVSKQTGDVHDYVPVGDNGMYLIANRSGVPAAGGELYRPIVVDQVAGGGLAPGVWIFDPSWSGELINVFGVTAGATFRLETAICVEYEPATNSPFVPLSQKPAPLAQRSVDSAQRSVNNLPVALPGVAITGPTSAPRGRNNLVMMR
jgi:hypothetical protein